MQRLSFLRRLPFFKGVSAPELLGNGTVGSGTVGKEPLEPDPAEERAVFDAIYWNGGSRAWDLLLCWRPQN